MTVDPDQVLVDVDQEDIDDNEPEEGVLVAEDSEERPHDHGVDEELLELHTALEAQEAGML